MGSNVIVHGKDSTQVLQNDSGKPQTIPIEATSNALHTWLISQLAGERNPGTANQYAVGVPESNFTSWLHSDGDVIVTSNPALLFGVMINVALTGDVAIRDGTTAGGTLIITTGSTVNTFYEFPGIKCDNGLFIDDNATAGNILVFWRDQ